MTGDPLSLPDVLISMTMEEDVADTNVGLSGVEGGPATSQYPIGLQSLHPT